MMTQLRQRMLEELQRRNYSAGTIRLYLLHVATFAQHFHRPPDQLGAEHIRQYQLFLIQQKKLAWSSYNQIVCALRFFYAKTLKRSFLVSEIPFPRMIQQLPLILSQEEVARMLTAPEHLKSRALLMTIYAAGLRRSEVARVAADRLVRGSSGEKPFLRFVFSPVLSQGIQQNRGQHHHAIFLPFPLMDGHGHAFRVDVADSQAVASGYPVSPSVTRLSRWLLVAVWM
jgi:Phage integrase, N-terminal SAM-like domain